MSNECQMTNAGFWSAAAERSGDTALPLTHYALRFTFYV